MMRPVRALFFASLACLLGPFALSERAPQADAVKAPVLAASPVRAEAHPSPDAARLPLPGLAGERSTDPPFSSRRSVPLVTASTVVATTPAAPPAFTAAALIDRLPPSRAPPTLS